MDKYLLWHRMTVEQRMNTVCDTEAKRAVARNTRRCFQREGMQLLPGEDAAVFVHGENSQVT